MEKREGPGTDPPFSTAAALQFRLESQNEFREQFVTISSLDRSTRTTIKSLSNKEGSIDMNEENRLPQGVVTAPRVRHPKQLLSEAWLRSLSFFRSSRRKIVQSPTKQLEKGPVMMASCSVPSQPMVSQQSSSFAIQHKTQQHLPKPTIDVRLDCPIIMGYLLKYSELEHNCEVNNWMIHLFDLFFLFGYAISNHLFFHLWFLCFLVL